MGDNILMKKLSLSLILLASLLTANELAWVDEQVNAIKPARVGENNSNISRIKNPFIFLKKNGYNIDKINTTNSSLTKKITSSTNSTKNSLQATKQYYSSSSFTLGMVINNSAYINGKWFKIGDKINNYKITKIAKSSVTLKQNSIIKVISIATKNNNLKFKR